MTRIAIPTIFFSFDLIFFPKLRMAAIRSTKIGEMLTFEPNHLETCPNNSNSDILHNYLILTKIKMTALQQLAEIWEILTLEPEIKPFTFYV